MSPADEADLRRLILAEYHSSRAYPASNCSWKEAFNSYGLAAEVAERMRRHDRAHPYRCSYCGLWHIGTRGFKPESADRRKQRLEVDGEVTKSAASPVLQGGVKSADGEAGLQAWEDVK